MARMGEAQGETVMDGPVKREAQTSAVPRLWRSIDNGTGRAPALAAAAGLLAAIASSSCCILPVAFFSLGVSGAWIANFTALAPYKPFFAGAAIGFIGLGYWLVRRAAQRACVVHRGRENRPGRREPSRRRGARLRLRRPLSAALATGGFSQ
jgi:MerT mercuric transport protein